MLQDRSFHSCYCGKPTNFVSIYERSWRNLVERMNGSFHWVHSESFWITWASLFESCDTDAPSARHSLASCTFLKIGRFSETKWNFRGSPDPIVVLGHGFLGKMSGYLTRLFFRQVFRNYSEVHVRTTLSKFSKLYTKYVKSCFFRWGQFIDAAVLEIAQLPVFWCNARSSPNNPPEAVS